MPALTELSERYLQTRRASERLCEPLAVEDYVVQSMPDASPTRWHLAHTTWFFETFVLAQWEPGYRPENEDFQRLFNSYYNSVGQPFPRARRGLLTRPTVAEVFAYRQAIDERMARLLADGPRDAQEAARVVELGIHHEQQHQELILTDLKHLLSCNPLLPTYRPRPAKPAAVPVESNGWSAHVGGVVEVGYEGTSFCFDNERPRHRQYLQPFELQNRLVTNAEFRAFINDGGYRRPELWLSLGWSTKNAEDWHAPHYWLERDGAWHEFSLHGLHPLEPLEPVCHVSYFEADAFARWSGARLPTEAEWEHAVATTAPHGPPDTSDTHCHPRPLGKVSGPLEQLYGDVWQWTASPYTAYPGYVAPSGALGEYNGKFMCNQYVLRGSSCGTPSGHARATYRNFFQPEARWQFTGLRLARDA